MKHPIALEEIYNATFDDEAFDHLLHRFARALGARSFLAGWHYLDGTATLFADSGYWSKEQLDRYAGEFALSDIWSVALVGQQQSNKAVDMTAIVPDVAYSMSEVFNEFFRSMGDDTWRALALPTFNSMGGGAIGFHRGQGQRGFESEAVSLLQEYSEHLGRMLAIRGRVSAMERANGSLRVLTEASGQANLLVDSSLRILQCNTAAREILEDSGALYRRGDRLTCHLRQDEEQLTWVVRQAVKREGPQPGAVEIRSCSGPPLVLSVTPSPGRAGEAVVFFGAHWRRDNTLPLRLRSLFKLTEAEADIAIQLAEGLSISDIAENRRATVGTLRVQLKSILTKLDCRSQAQVVSKVSRLPQLQRGMARH